MTLKAMLTSIIVTLLAISVPTRVMAQTASATPLAPGSCEALRMQALGANATIEDARPDNLARDGQEPNWAAKLSSDVAGPPTRFCRVKVRSSPFKGSAIAVEVWLPAAGWNGRLLGTGNGGYPDRISYRDMSAGLARGFAVVSTDMGLAAHVSERRERDDGNQAGGRATERDITTVFVGHPNRVRDFASRATHEMTWIAKSLIRSFYGQDATYSYFVGCSTGGMQGMAESQRYPNDYDAILAGDPGANRARLHLGVLWNSLATQGDVARIIPPGKLELLNQTALAACGAQTGAPFLPRPDKCGFDPTSLRCIGAEKMDCLTSPQLATALALYAGPRNPRTGVSYLPGLPPGSELGWGMWMKAASATQPQYLGLFQAALGENFTFDHFDWDRDATTFVDVMGPQLDSFSPDLRAFAKRGGRLLIYYGSADSLTPVGDIIQYQDRFQALAEALNSAEARRLKDAFRLFIIPGMGHCAGGQGPSDFDGLGSLMRWREQAIKPALLAVTAKDRPTSLACAFPASAVHGRCNLPSLPRQSSGTEPQ